MCIREEKQNHFEYSEKLAGEMGNSKEFLQKVVNWSTHITNKRATFVVQILTSKEAQNGRKLGVEHFKIFKRITYAHVRDQKRKKLDDKGEKHVFLGVREICDGYKLYNPLIGKILTSRDVFDEESVWG